MDRLTKLTALAAVHLANSGYPGGLDNLIGRGEPIKTRKCLNCGADKQHNNAYCSSACCKEHKSKKQTSTPLGVCKLE